MNYTEFSHNIIPAGFALVPLKPTKEMEEVFNEEDWQWEDLLAASGQITEEQYDEIVQLQRIPEQYDSLCESYGQLLAENVKLKNMINPV